MPQFPEEYVTEGWVETVVADTDHLLVNNNAVEAKDLAVAMARAPQTTQTVTTSPAVVSARFIVLADDSHTSGAPGSLVMPPITAGAWHVINALGEDVHYLVTKDVGDPVGTGPDYQLGTTSVRTRMIFIFAAESGGQLRWQYDESGEYIEQILAALNTLGAYGIGALVIGGTSDTITGELDVYVTNASAAITILLPDAAEGRRIRLHKFNSATTQTITLVLSAADFASGTINGVAASYDIVLTSIEGPRRSWDICAPTPLAWHVSDGETIAIAQLADDLDYEVGEIDIRLDALEAIATAPLSSTTGTTLSWEAQERVRLANTGTTHCLVTLNGDTTEWPVGRARALSQYGSTTGGFTLAVPSGHKLNTVTNGTSGVIGTAAADDGTALYTAMVTREASDEWSWA